MGEIIAILKKAFFFFNYYYSVTFYNYVFKRISCRNFICYKVYIPPRQRASPDACLYLSKNKQTEVVNENSKIIIK